MSAVYIPTRRGVRAFLARSWERLNVALVLAGAERDREHLEQQLAAIPPRLRQLDLDIGALRVRQVHLRNS